MDSDEKIIEIFNNMNFERKPNPENDSNDQNYSSNKFSPDNFYESLKISEEPKFRAELLDYLESGYRTWKQTPPAWKSDLLHKVSETLKDKSKLLQNLESELTILSDYFAFYSDMPEQIPKEEDIKTEAKICKTVCVILPPQPYSFILGATVPAALAGGCSVRVFAEKQQVIPFLLQKILIDAGLPSGVFTAVMIEGLEGQGLTPFLSDHFLHIVYCGYFPWIYKTVFSSADIFKYFSPNNTTALFLESCDLNAAVTEIFCKTWECVSFWGVSTVVVQESILHKFLDVLRLKMKHFIIKNNDKSKFKDKKISDRINAAILKASATVEKASFKDNEWGPVALINHQFEEMDLPILNVLVCRTAKEGVKLLNNCCYSLGTSIWSEISAQALEIASELKSPNIWINCHGISDAKVPLVVTGLSGDCMLGGTQGLLEYLHSDQPCYLPGKSHITFTIQESQVSEVAILAQKAFDLWHPNENKRKYFKALADSLEKEKEFSESFEIFRNVTLLTNRQLFHEKNHTDEFFIIHKEAPVGVICLFLFAKINIKLLSLLIAFAIKFGNAVIIVTEIENSYLTTLVNLFNKIFPKNLLSVINNEENGMDLISDPIVQAVWCDNYLGSVLEFQAKEEPSKIKLHLWPVNENVLKIPDLIHKECTKRKVIWLPKVEKFP